MSNIKDSHTLSKRFRGYFPVIIDVETAGFDCEKDALLEIAAITVTMDAQGFLQPANTFFHHIIPFPGANLDPKALEFTGIKPYHPFRFAVEEDKALKEIFEEINKAMKAAHCNRCVLVGHNAAFDLGFINAACARTKNKKNPFHGFTTFDTACLSALVFGQTVLAKALEEAKIPFDSTKAHSAIYDAEKTAELFCHIVNKWKSLGGWP